jgi:hypothetical protein
MNKRRQAGSNQEVSVSLCFACVLVSAKCTGYRASTWLYCTLALAHPLIFKSLLPAKFRVKIHFSILFFHTKQESKEAIYSPSFLTPCLVRYLRDGLLCCSQVDRVEVEGGKERRGKVVLYCAMREGVLKKSRLLDRERVVVGRLCR